jgi:hypothetical protein
MTRMGQILGHDSVRLPPYAYGQHMHVLKQSVYVQYGYGKQFEVAVSHHNDMSLTPQVSEKAKSWAN